MGPRTEQDFGWGSYLAQLTHLKPFYRIFLHVVLGLTKRLTPLMPPSDPWAHKKLSPYILHMQGKEV
jgi:hypothetical protein